MTHPPTIIARSGVHKTYCPICKHYFLSSPYLVDTFKDHAGATWLSNVVMHYRHQHRKYDRNIQYVQHSFGISPAEQKKVINEQAKRQILRKSYGYMVYHQIGIDSLLKMNTNSEQTIDLWKKYYNVSE